MCVFVVRHGSRPADETKYFYETFFSGVVRGREHGGSKVGRKGGWRRQLRNKVGGGEMEKGKE